jgi:hypothetical protein
MDLTGLVYNPVVHIYDVGVESSGIQVDIFWVLTPCCVVVGYQPFREVHAASIFRVKMEAAWT